MRDSSDGKEFSGTSKTALPGRHAQQVEPFSRVVVGTAESFEVHAARGALDRPDEDRDGWKLKTRSRGRGCTAPISSASMV